MGSPVKKGWVQNKMRRDAFKGEKRGGITRGEKQKTRNIESTEKRVIGHNNLGERGGGCKKDGCCTHWCPAKKRG